MSVRGGWSTWLVNLYRNVVHGRTRDAAVADDVEAYLQALIEEKRREGHSESEARRQALVEFGGVESVKEQVRRVRAGAWAAEAARDIRYAIRLARRTPAFTLTAILTLALGIGANTAVFSVVNAVLLRSLPYGSPERIVKFQNLSDSSTFGVSERERLLYGTGSTVFSSFTTYYFTSLTLTGGGEAERARTIVADVNLLTTLAVGALLGRGFEPADAAGGPSTAVMLTEHFWDRRFSRDPDIIGRSLVLNGRARTVVGILPGAVRVPGDFGSPAAEILVPLVLAGQPDPENIHYLDAIGRLADGVSVEQANVRLRARAVEVAQEISTLPDGYSARAIPVADVVLGDVRTGLFAVTGAVALLLLLTCGNLAGLILARSRHRRAELSLRAALGASKGRLRRQLVTESLLLALVGGVAGVWLARLGTQLLVAMAPDLPRLDQVSVDGVVLSVTTLLTVVTGVVIGVVPAWTLARRGGASLIATASDRGRTTALRGRRTLVALQVALSVALAIGAGLLGQSAVALVSVDPGFDPSGAVTLRVTMSASGFPDRAATQRFEAEALERIRALPGVIAAGATTHLPLVDGQGDWGLMIEGLPERDENGSRPNADWSAVTAGYFEALGVRLIEGRTYGPGDVEGAPLVTMINETMARAYFPDRSPIGRRMRMSSTRDPVYREIVGVVADIRHDGFAESPARQMFLPLAQFPQGDRSGGGTRALVVRSAGDPLALIPAIRRRLAELDPNVPVSQVQLMDDVAAAATAVPRLYAVLFGLFSVLAVGIVCVGVYGTASYYVAIRRREFAVRRALGASRASIVRLVTVDGGVPALAGVLLGVVAAFGTARVLDSLLFGISAHDLSTFLIMPIVVILCAAVANLIPAWLAVAENPTVALRR